MIKTDKIEFIVFYGSLMLDFDAAKELAISDMLHFRGKCKMRGKLYDMGAYPAFLPDDNIDNSVAGELYEIIDKRVLKILDRFERCDFEDKDNALYLRKKLRLKNSDIIAWVYVFNQTIIGKKNISDGDWHSYMKRLIKS